MKITVQIARVLTGLLFIFSGVIKLNDPSGFSIKLNEYFDVFAHDVSAHQDTLKIVMMEGAKEKASKGFVLYSFDTERDLVIQSDLDTSQETTIEKKVVKKDTVEVKHTKVTYDVTIEAQLNGQPAADTEFELPDSFTVSMFTLKATVGGKSIFQKDYKVSVGNLVTAKNTLNLKEYVKKESWLNDLFKGMKGWTLWLSIFICALEVILGFALIVGWRIHFTAWLMLLLIVFFTFLTGYSWLSGFCPTGTFWFLMLLALALVIISGLIANVRIRNALLFFWLGYVLVFLLICKFTSVCFTCEFDKMKMKVTDCGCFGDFMHLEPSHSFFKDLILMLLILIVFFGRHHIKPWFSKKFGWKFMLVITLLSGGFGVYCYLYLPVWDFLPYKEGNNIKEVMTHVPAGQRASDSISMVYVMHKGNDSVEVPFLAPSYKEFSEKSKAGWKVGRRIDKVIIEGYKNPIHDFVITDPKTGAEMRDTFLDGKDYQIMLVLPFLDKAYSGANKDVNEIYNWAKGKKYRFWALTSSGDDLVKSWTQVSGAKFSFYTSDQKTLMTIGRYNPTLYLFKGPVVVRKWSGRNLPSIKRLEKLTSK